MNIEEAFQNLENLQNAAVKGGLFAEAKHVVGMQSSFEAIKKNTQESRDFIAKQQQLIESLQAQVKTLQAENDKLKVKK